MNPPRHRVPFDSCTNDELQGLLGKKTEQVLPDLEFGVWLYRELLKLNDQGRAAKSELAGIGKLLGKLDEAVAELSPSTKQVLQRTYDPQDLLAALRSSDLQVESAFRALEKMRSAVGDYRRIIDAHPKKRINPRRYLAHVVGRALVRVGIPLSKGHNALPAQVLRIVFHVANPEMRSDEVFPYLQEAVEAQRRLGKTLHVKKGRPSTTK